MGSKLYVANLPNAPSAIALRAHFGTCGVVTDVEIIADRNAGRGRGSAIVRMGSPAAAERALAQLNGSPFAGQLLLIEAAPEDAADRRAATPRAAPQSEGDARARITMQFREPANMTYELDCGGSALVLRVFFPDAAGAFRIKAQLSAAADAPSADATAASRVEALRSVARACREDGGAAALSQIDWDAVEQAMTKVRAI